MFGKSGFCSSEDPSKKIQTSLEDFLKKLSQAKSLNPLKNF